MKQFFIIIVFIWIVLASHAQTKEVPYTLDDRDRIIRVEAKMEAVETKMEALEAKMEALETKMDVKFETLETKMDVKFETLETKMDVKFETLETKLDVKLDAVNARIDYLFWLIGFIAMLIIFMLGYMIWDRRTALKPALEKASKAEDKSQNIILALRDFARKNADFAEVLRTHGLL